MDPLTLRLRARVLASPVLAGLGAATWTPDRILSELECTPTEAADVLRAVVASGLSVTKVSSKTGRVEYVIGSGSDWPADVKHAPAPFVELWEEWRDAKADDEGIRPGTRANAYAAVRKLVAKGVDPDALCEASRAYLAAFADQRRRPSQTSQHVSTFFGRAATWEEWAGGGEPTEWTRLEWRRRYLIASAYGRERGAEVDTAAMAQLWETMDRATRRAWMHRIR